MRPTVLLSVGCIVILTGCAALVATPVPRRVDRGSYPECGTPGVAMGSDVILGVVGGLIFVGGAADGESGTLAVGGAMTGLFLGSAIYGALVEKSCREARAAAIASLDTLPLRARAASWESPAGPVAPPASPGPPASPPTPVAPAPPSISPENR